MPASSLSQFYSSLDAAINPNPLTVSPQTPLSEVFSLMCRSRKTCQFFTDDQIEDVETRCVLVIDDDRLVGLLSLGDIVRLIAEGMLDVQVSISQVMTAEPITVKRSQFENPFTLIHRFNQYQICHLPILSDQGQVLGLVTLESLRCCLPPLDFLKFRRVEEVMRREVIYLSPSATVKQATQQLAKSQNNCLVIAEKIYNHQLQPLGFITAGDLVQFYALGLDDRIRVDQIMNFGLPLIHPDDNLIEADRRIQQHRISQLFVSSKPGQIAGIITPNCILKGLDPMEMYGVIQLLQQQVSQLPSPQNGKVAPPKPDLNAAIVETVSNLVVVLDSQGKIIRFNQASEAVTGYSFREVQNQIFWEIFLSSEEQQQFQANFQTLPSSEFPPQQELTWLTKGGLQASTVSHFNSTLYNDAGQVEYVILTGEDITQYRQREKADDQLTEERENRVDEGCEKSTQYLAKYRCSESQSQSEKERLKFLLSANPAIIYSCDYQTYKATFISENVQLILGYDPEEFLESYEFWWERVHPDDQAFIAVEMNKIYEQGYYRYEYRFRHQDGNYRWMRDEVKLVQDERGNPVELVGYWIEISEYKETEVILQEQEAILSSLCNSTTLMMGVVEILDNNIRHLWDNPATAKLLGCEVQQLKNNTCRGLGIPENLTVLWVKHCQETQQTQKPTHFEYTHQTIKGENWLSATICPVPGNFSRPRCCYVVEDITERKRTEEALRHSTQNLLESQRIAHLGNWDFDVTTGKISWSEEVFRIFGLDPCQDKPNLEEWLEMIHSEDREQCYNILQRSLNTGEYFDIEYRLIRPDGELRYLHSQGEVIENLHSQAIRLFGVIIDITEQKLADQALCASEARYRALVEQMPATVYTITVGEASMPLYISPHIEQMLGYTTDEWMSNPQLWCQCLHPEDREQAGNRLKNLPSHDRPFVCEYRLLTRNQDVLWVQDAAVVIRDEDQTPILLQGLMLDITERKHTEVALRQSEERFSTLIRNLSVGVTLHGSEGEVLLCNPKAWQLVGLSEAELLGMTSLPPQWKMIHEDGSPFPYNTHPVPQAILTRQAVKNVLMGIYRPSGKGGGETELIWVLVSAEPQLTEDGTVQQVICTCSDITILKKVQEDLRTSEQLYRTIAHNFPNGTIFLFDHNLRYLVADGQGLAHLQLRREALEGYTLSEVLSAETCTSVEPLYQTALAGSERVEEIQYQDQTYLVRAVPIRNEEGEVILGMIVYQNITEHKQAELALQRANQHLAEINQRLEQSVQELEQRHRESAIINQMIEFLQACHGVEEAYGPISEFLKQLFPGCSGTVLLSNQKTNQVESIATFGELAACELNLAFDDCWALRRGQIHLASDSQPGLFCTHVHGDPLPTASLCIPTIVQAQAFGLFYLRTQEFEGLSKGQQQLAQTVAEQISLGLSNLQLREELRNQSIRDPLTGLFNRRYLKEVLQREFQRSQRSGQPLGIIMVDIDYFKQFNDHFGHEAGDVVLQEVARFLQRKIRLSDVACRYGGEEMTLILPEMSLETVKARAEQLCQGIRQLQLFYQGKDLGRITASFGVACFPDQGSTPETVIKKADEALYQAKNQGRNQVICA